MTLFEGDVILTGIALILHLLVYICETFYMMKNVFNNLGILSAI